MMNNASRIVYLNGEFLPVDQAKISVMDRGFLFSDGVYEVLPMLDRRLVGLEGHLQRLRKSLVSISLFFEFDDAFFINIFKTLVERNADQGDNRTIYLQISRGASDTRAHVFPSHPVNPTIFVQTTPLDEPNMEVLKQGGAVIAVEDVRWQWCHIKSVSLLPNVLSSQEAKEAGAKEAILMRAGRVMEGASSNVFVIKNGQISTPPPTKQILRGITRDIVLTLAEKNQIPCREEDVLEKALYDADEVWVTSSTREILPIVKVGDHVVGDGKAGPVWLRMMALYQAYKDTLPRL